MKRDLDQMLRAIEHTSPAQTYHVDLRAAGAPARDRVARYRRVAVLVTAMLVFSVMFAFLIIALRQEPALPPDPPLSTDIPSEELPPWLNGTLSVTTLTYGSLAKTDLSLLKAPSLVPLSEEYTPTKSRNISISLQPNASLKGTESASLLRIRPTSGEHQRCAAVYYDIDDDQMFCLSCELYDAIIEEPLYRDTWMRAILEEGLFCPAANTNKSYHQDHYAVLYQAMYDNDLSKKLVTAYPKTIEDLGFTEEMLATLPENFIFSATAIPGRLAMSSWEPRIEVISYGIEKKQCLFSLLTSRDSPGYDYCYGTYLYNFTTRTLIRLEGDSRGVARRLGCSVDSSQEKSALDMTRALSIHYIDGYKMIAATVPWQLPSHQPEYTVVCFNTLTGQVSLPFATAPSSFGTKLTNTPAIVQDGILISEFYQVGGIHNRKTNGYGFSNLHGMSTMINFGARTHLMSLEYLFWIDGEAYVKMHLGTDEHYKEEGYVFFRLRDGEMVTTLFDDGTLVVPDTVFYQYDGVKRTDTRTGESVALYDGKVLTSVATRNERYMYLLPKEADRIVCIDRQTGVTGEIALPDAFVEQLAQTGATSYSLCLNYAEDSLMLIFKPDEVLLFDREGFAVSDWESDVFTRLYAGDTVAAFDLAAERMLPYYLHNGYSLRFTNEPLVKEALSLLLQQAFEAQEDAMSQEELILLFASVGEQLFDHLTYDGDTATVTAQDLEALRRQ